MLSSIAPQFGRDSVSSVSDSRRTYRRILAARVLLVLLAVGAAATVRGPTALAFAQAEVGLPAAPSRTAAATNRLRAEVRPIAPRVLMPRPAAPASIEFIGKYYESIHQWGKVVASKVRPVPAHPDRRYLGLPLHTEDDVRPPAYAAMVLAFLAEYEPPRLDVAQSDRAAWREAAIGLLRYLSASHVSGGGVCVNGKPWGNQWQSAMWARAAGMAGWFLWDDLDESLQAAVSRLVEFEADRFVRQAPRSSLLENTGAEENAWNAQITSLACNMMPSHPRAKAWEEASLRYMYNSFSVAADAADATPGDWGRPIKDWVATVNAHDDFTVENHGLVHMGYLKNTASEIQECILPWLITGQKAPAACMHHIPDVFEVLIRCMAWDGGPLYFAGTDWKIYHEQTCEVGVYAMLSLLKKDRRAAFLERTAVEWITRQQDAEKGYYNVRRDLEYGGLCATRLIACCLAHGIVDSSPEPVTAAEFDRLASGTLHLVAGKAVVHRTPGKLASFAWAQKRMALAVPREGTWVVWPLFASCLGIVDGQDSSQRHALLQNIDVDVKPDGFRASGRLLRCKGQVVQDFFFASPAGDYAVYVERLQPRNEFPPNSRETGVIGLEYPVDSNHRVLYGPWGAMKTTGYGGRARVHVLAGNWLNIDHRVGYVVLRPDGRANVIRYHDESRGSGRVPQLQEWLSLVGEGDALRPSKPSWACVVTFLNQPAEHTARWAAQARFRAHGDTATCEIGKDVFRVDFAAREADPQRDGTSTGNGRRIYEHR